MKLTDVVTDLSERFKIPRSDVEKAVLLRASRDYKSSWTDAQQSDDWEIRAVEGHVGVRVLRATPYAQKSQSAYTSGLLIGTNTCRKLDIAAARADGVDMRDPDALVKYMKEVVQLIIG